MRYAMKLDPDNCNWSRLPNGGLKYFNYAAVWFSDIKAVSFAIKTNAISSIHVALSRGNVRYSERSFENPKISNKLLMFASAITEFYHGRNVRELQNEEYNHATTDDRSTPEQWLEDRARESARAICVALDAMEAIVPYDSIRRSELVRAPYQARLVLVQRYGGPHLWKQARAHVRFLIWGWRLYGALQERACAEGGNARKRDRDDFEADCN